jgi:hypothetical protein
MGYRDITCIVNTDPIQTLVDEMYAASTDAAIHKCRLRLQRQLHKYYLELENTNQLVRQAKEGADQMLLAFQFGFRSFHHNKYGWSSFDLEDLIEIELKTAKPGHAEFNKINIDRGPNNKYAYGLWLSDDHGGGHVSGPSIYDKSFDDILTCYNAAKSDVLDWIGRKDLNKSPKLKKAITFLNTFDAEEYFVSLGLIEKYSKPQQLSLF